MSKRKRLTRKEKIALSEASKKENGVIEELNGVNLQQNTPFKEIDPEILYISDKEIKKKIVIYTEEDACDDDFNPPCKFYFVYCTGHHIYIKTRDRMKAQEICDKISGKEGFYTVKIIFKAVAR